MYEREQVVRRELEGEVGRLRQEVDVLRADLAYTRASAADEANNAERTKVRVRAWEWECGCGCGCYMCFR